MKLFKNKRFNLFTKHIILIVIFNVLFFSFNWFYILPNIEKFSMEEKRARIKNIVEMPYSILDGLNNKVLNKEMTLDSAKAEAQKILRMFKYDNANYIFIFNESQMLIHSDDTTREGKDLSFFKDINNFSYLKEAIIQCGAYNDEAYITYYRAKPKTNEPLPKLSYIKRFQPWNYYIGSGFYYDDIEAQINSYRQATIIVVIFFAIAFFLISLTIARSITYPLIKLSDAAKNIAAGNYQSLIPKTNTTDETSELAESFSIMQRELHLTMEILINTSEKLKETNEMLEAANSSLESKVEERTKYIENTKNLLEVENDERKNLIEKLNASNTEKDKFFAIIAHDLRGPLSSFEQITALLSKDFGKLGAVETTNLINMLDKSAKRVYSLLENLLEWSRSQRGLTKFEPVHNSIHFVVAHAIEILETSALNKNIVIKNLTTKDVFLNFDINMINTVLRNIISNAVKFTQAGGEITISCHDLDNESLYAKIAIKDTGVGIAHNDIDKLFRMDVVYSEIGTKGEKGSGLGLILCKEFIERHKGKIWAESELGKGTTFFFTLPKI